MTMRVPGFLRILRENSETAAVVLNKPGGENTIGGKFVVDAKPDGYTLGFLTTARSLLKSIHP